MADHAFAIVLEFAHGLPGYTRRQSQSLWRPGGISVVHLAEASLGIIGLGAIGLDVAARARASSMRVAAVDPALKAPAASVDRIFRRDELHAMLASSDFVVCCVPLTVETEHKIAERESAVMKTSAFIINVGRGKVFSLDALTAALESGQIAGAGLDVFEQEPLPESHPRGGWIA